MLLNKQKIVYVQIPYFDKRIFKLLLCTLSRGASEAKEEIIFRADNFFERVADAANLDVIRLKSKSGTRLVLHGEFSSQQLLHKNIHRYNIILFCSDDKRSSFSLPCFSLVPFTCKYIALKVKLHMHHTYIPIYIVCLELQRKDVTSAISEDGVCPHNYVQPIKQCEVEN